MKRSARALFLFSVVIAALLLSSHIVPVMAQTSMDKWAVIACGGKDNQNQDNFENQIAEAYNTLLQCGFVKDHIYYLDLNVSRDVDNDNITDVDAYTSVENVSSAITDWLATRSDSDDLVFIYLEDHGGDEYWICNPDEVIYYSNLSDWIEQVSYFRLVFVVDACESATMIDDLSMDNRILIASAIGEGRPWADYLLFSHAFFQRVLNMSIYDAFLEAAEHTYNITHMLVEIGAISEEQWAVLDDNGDGDCHKFNSPPKYYGDGYLSDVTYLYGSYCLNVRTFSQDMELFDVEVWFDEEFCGGSPVIAVVAEGNYTVEVNSSFLRTEEGQDYNYTFHHWENNSTDNLRTIFIQGDQTITAYYRKVPVTLTVKTRQTNGVEIEDVKVWIDYDPNHYLSPVTINVTAGNHTVEVESMFIRTEFPDFYVYTFVRWEDYSTDNPRTVPVYEDRTIIAYYKKEYAGSIFKPTP